MSGNSNKGIAPEMSAPSVLFIMLNISYFHTVWQHTYILFDACH